MTTVLVLGLLVGWFWWQQNGLSSETITVSSAPDGFDGYRIAVVSDLHAKEFGEGNRVLLDYVRDLEPDLVAVVGDILHEPDQMSMIPAVAKGLAAIAPTYYVTGNHEWAAGVVRELEPLLEQCGVTVLSNEYVMLERNGDRIALLGAEDSNGYADQKTVQELADQVRQEQGAVYEILLSHRNNHYEQYTQARVDLTLAGHAHGGLIRLPGTDGLVGPKRELFPQYTAGLYDLSYGQMVVSRGLGNQFPLLSAAEPARRAPGGVGLTEETREKEDTEHEHQAIFPGPAGGGSHLPGGFGGVFHLGDHRQERRPECLSGDPDQPAGQRLGRAVRRLYHDGGPRGLLGDRHFRGGDQCPVHPHVLRPEPEAARRIQALAPAGHWL